LAVQLPAALDALRKPADVGMLAAAEDGQGLPVCPRVGQSADQGLQRLEDGGLRRKLHLYR
jgi:hypothetical protein